MYRMAFNVCPFCGCDVLPTRTTMWTVQLICDRCGRRRQASDSETDEWIERLDIRCPVCEAMMRVRRADGLDIVCLRRGCSGNRVTRTIEAAANGDPLPASSW